MTRRALLSMTIAAMATVLSCGSFGTTPPEKEAGVGEDRGDAGGGGADSASSPDADSETSVVLRETGCSQFEGHAADLTDVIAQPTPLCMVCSSGTNRYFNMHLRDPLPKAAGKYEVEVQVRLASGAIELEVGFIVDGAVTGMGGAVTTEFSTHKYTYVATKTEALQPGVFADYGGLPSGRYCFVVKELIVRRLP